MRMFIFLDIDGVLNKRSQWRIHSYPLDSGCIEDFCNFANHIGGKIILTSSWRKGFVCSHSSSNSRQIQELEKELDRYNIRISGKVSDNISDRTDAINQFLNNHPDRYIIIDDDKNEFNKLLKHLHLTNPETGFSQEDFECLKNLMKSKRIHI